LENLHAEYGELGQRAENIEIKSTYSRDHKEELEEMKSDLALAISNRTLALIEFKLMNTSGDTRMHSELLEIHTENSRKYMSSAAIHMKTLDELPVEGNYSSVGKPAATSRRQSQAGRKLRPVFMQSQNGKLRYFTIPSIC